MRLLTVLGSDEKSLAISKQTEPLGYEIIHYCHVLKAMDNIDEIHPHAIIVSAQDFPRHWKILVRFVRTVMTKESCPIILLKGDNFPEEEKSKASFLGVNLQLNETLNDQDEIDQMLNLLSRHRQSEERRMYNRLTVEPWHRFGFMFVRPSDKLIIHGDLVTISMGGLSFKPADASLMNDIDAGIELEECSLRIGGDIYSISCHILRISSIVSLQFSSIPEQGKEVLSKYLQDFSS